MGTRRAASTLNVCLGIAAGAIAVAFLLTWFFWPPARVHEPLARTFDGTSDQLTRTVIVPTLDTPLPEGKSAIWCSSFQLAWNRLRDDVIHKPIILEGTEAISERLNHAESSEKDLAPDSYYAAAGWGDEGIVDKVRRDMATKFPGVPVMDLSMSEGGALAYGYVTAKIHYPLPYRDDGDSLRFPIGNGEQRRVGSFGFHEHEFGTDDLRKQADLLFYSSGKGEPPEFAVDLDHQSAYQVVAACIARPKSLADAWEIVRAKSATDTSGNSFVPNDSLLVPNMSWRIVHHFKELEGKAIQNIGPPSPRLDEAVQVIDLTMDRSGTQLESEASMKVKSSIAKRHLHFDRPYLLYLQKRDAKQPFFAMWVDNAELLQYRLKPE